MKQAPHSLWLAELSWQEVEQALLQGYTSLLLMLGATEQHGGHLPLATDSLIGEELARRVASELGNTLIAPVVSLGTSDEHLEFAGTLSLAKSTLAAIIADVARSASRHGFKRLIVLTAHGGNFEAVRAGMTLVRQNYPEIEVVAPADLLLSPVGQPENDLFEPLEAVDEQTAGWHAGERETSQMLYLKPELVQMARAEVGFTGDFRAVLPRMMQAGLRPVTANGVLGDPTTANPVRGEKYLRQTANAMVVAIKATWAGISAMAKLPTELEAQVKAVTKRPRLSLALPEGSLASEALQEFCLKAISHPEVAGVVLYGSALWKTEPGDLDLVILLDKPDYYHSYGVHPAGRWRCEVEYVTAPVIEQFFTHPQWRVANWELDVGAKYIHSQILYDRLGVLGKARQRFLGAEGLGIRRYLFIHQVGQATSRLEKLARVTPEQAPAVNTDFRQALQAAHYHATLSFPRGSYLPESWELSKEQRTALQLPGWSEAKAELLAEVERTGLKGLGLIEIIANCRDAAQVLEQLPLYHLVDVTGLERLLARVRPDLALPADLMMTSFNQEFSPQK